MAMSVQYPSSASNVSISASAMVLLIISAILTNSFAFSSSPAIALMAWII